MILHCSGDLVHLPALDHAEQLAVQLYEPLDLLFALGQHLAGGLQTAGSVSRVIYSVMVASMGFWAALAIWVYWENIWPIFPIRAMS